MDPGAIEMRSKFDTIIKLEQKGSITLLEGMVKRTKIGPDTIAFFWGGSPCQKISKGILYQKDEDIMVGLHQEPSNLFWKWQGAMATLASVNGNNLSLIHI